MCEYSGKLVAWLDAELTGEEAAKVEVHLGHCDECRKAASVYREISETFLDCYEATTVCAPRKSRFWMVALAGAAAAILVAVVLRPQPAERLIVHLPPALHAPQMAFERPISPAAIPAAPARHAVVRRTVRTPPVALVRTAEVEPMVQVVLPADALFPPGAVPAGFSYIAEVRPRP